MAIIAEFPKELGRETPLFTTTHRSMPRPMAMGLGDQDTAAVFEVLEVGDT